MFQMATPRSSVFTFESTVHSSHVLQWLDEQRRRDLLCDVTVLVEGQSFRAHRSVLASCSDYFAQRISSLVQHGAVLTLPDEVTTAGFEPLLKFAYTSKLHFGKEDVLEIQSAASLLGFKDLDEACFDFLLPKLFSSNKSPPRFVRKCCKKACKRRFTKENGGTDSDVLGDKEAKPVADSSSQRDAAWERGKSVKKKTGSASSAVPAGPPVEDMDVAVLQCPKYRKFQLACEKENGEKIPTKSRIRDACALSCFQCSSSPLLKSKTASNEKINGGAKEPPSSEIHEATQGLDAVKNDSLEEEQKQNEKVAEDTFRDKMGHLSGTNPLDTSNAKLVSPGSSPTPGENSEFSLPTCPLIALNELSTICRSVQHEEIATNVTENQDIMNAVAAEPGSLHQNMPEAEGTSLYYVCQDGGKGRQTGSMERSTFLSKEKEVADLLPATLGSRTGASQPNFQEWAQSPSPNAKNSCPFLLELHPASCPLSEMSECEVASQSGVSSVNSGEDGDSETETEGDCDFAARERALQVRLPYPVEWIVSLSRNDFQQLLKQQTFTREQLDFVHDMRRRSKNRLAAQRCRKRKLDCIYNLQCEILKLKTEREKLLLEQNQLNQMKMKTCHTVNTLCQRVCREADLQPDQLQVLASSDCPLSSFFPHIDSLLSQYGPPLRPQISVVASSGGRQFVASEDNLSSLNRDTIRVQHSL